MLNFRGQMNLGPLGCLLSLAVMAGLGWLFFQFYKLLWWAVPVFIVLAAIVDWRVVASWGRGLVAMIARNPLAGLIGLAFALVALPFTSLAMLLHAVNRRQIERWQREAFGEGGSFFDLYQKRQKQPENEQIEGEYIDFEEIETKPQKTDDGSSL